jgi:hypothetical protein
LGIIWVAFLLPARKRSPAASVEDFEKRMSLLAGANGSTTGRWVLMPRKGERFLGPENRQRVRIRRRRRVVFTLLLDTAGLTLLMGLFPPFRKVLVLTAVLAIALVAYTVLLARIRADERARERRRARAARRMAGRAVPEATYAPYRAAAYAPLGVSNGGDGNGRAVHARNGNGNGHASANGNGNGHAHANGNGNGNGHSNGNGHGYGNGHGPTADRRFAEFEPQFSEQGIRIIEDDVHVVVYRSDELDLRTGSAG